MKLVPYDRLRTYIISLNVCHKQKCSSYVNIIRLQVKAYALSDRLQEAEYGLNATVRTLEKYEDYFDVPYALPKLGTI